MAQRTIHNPRLRELEERMSIASAERQYGEEDATQMRTAELLHIRRLVTAYRARWGAEPDLSEDR